MFPSQSYRSPDERFSRGVSSSYDNFIQNISRLDPTTTVPANDILIQMRNLQDELLASQRTVDDLRTELKGARDALSHYEDVVVPKFEHHTELSRQNEAKLKALLTKLSAERETLSAEVNRLTSRMDMHLRDSAAAKSYQHVAEERAALLEATLEAMRSEYDAKLRAQTATSVADAVAESVDRVRGEFEKKLLAIVEDRRQENEEKDAIIKDLYGKLDSLEGEREELLTTVSALRTEISMREEAQSRADQELEQLRLTVEHLGRERDALSTRLNAYTEDLTELQGRLKATAAYNSELTNANHEMRMGSQSLRANLESFEEKQQRTKRYILHLTHVITVLESFIAKKIAQMKEVRAAQTTKSSGKNTPAKRPESGNPATGNPSRTRKSRPLSSENLGNMISSQKPQIPNLRLSTAEVPSPSLATSPDDNDAFLARIDARLHGIYENTSGSASVSPTPDESPYALPRTVSRSSHSGQSSAATPHNPQTATVHLHSIGMDLPMPAVNAQTVTDDYYSAMAPRSSDAFAHTPGDCCHQGICINAQVRSQPHTPAINPDAHLKPWVPVAARGTPLGSPPKLAAPDVGNWEKAPSFATIGIEDAEGNVSEASSVIIPSNYRQKLAVLTNELAKMRTAYTQAVGDKVGSRGGSHSSVAWESRNDPAFIQDVLADEKLRSMLEHGIDKKQRELFDLKETMNQSHADARRRNEDAKQNAIAREAERSRQEELLMRKHSLHQNDARKRTKTATAVRGGLNK